LSFVDRWIYDKKINIHVFPYKFLAKGIQNVHSVMAALAAVSQKDGVSYCK
jgi:hypothetical protein